ncbi:MAG TPA: flagellin [bacterium]|nr:flagellin [bacterium]
MGALVINHNTQAINTHRALLNVDRDLKTSLEHLSSGLKIVRAADGPAALMISEQMRAQVASVRQAIRNSETSVSMVQTTEASLDEMNKLLVDIRQLAIHAGNEGANDRNMTEADQFEIKNALESVDRISQFAQFGTRKILDGSNGVNGLAAGKGLTFIKATTATHGSPDAGYEVRVTQLATKAEHTAAAPVTPDVIDRGVSFKLEEGGRIASYTAKKGDDVNSIVRNLQQQADQNGLHLDVSHTDDGRLVVRERDYGADTKFSVVSSVAGVLSDEEGLPLAVDNGKDVAGTINNQLTYGKGRVLTAAPGTEADGLQVLYDGALPQDPQMAVGRVMVTQNSLVFQIGPNVGQKVRIALNALSSRTLGSNVVNDSHFANLSEVDVRTAQGAEDTLRLVDKAINDLNVVRGNLGAIQKNSLESNLRSLHVSEEELTSAESGIRDADMAEEISTFTRNQIIMQSAMAMLGQANQVPRNILSLLEKA